MAILNGEPSSSGHKLGQLIGDWFEEYFVFPLIKEVGAKLRLYPDNRCKKRPARGDKILWGDEYGNQVDYDAVLELHGTETNVGIPVAFIECFWRRGSRHSKDKARDDSGKLIPMKDTYPTARFLGIVASGDFTEPARSLVKSRNIDLFYIPKEKVIQAFSMNGLIMDYLDTASETEKAQIASSFGKEFTFEKKRLVADALIDLIGRPAVSSYVDRVRAKLSAFPQEIRIIQINETQPAVFKTLEEVTAFLENPVFQTNNPISNYMYQITYSDGDEFERYIPTIEDLQSLNLQIQLLANHISNLSL